MFSSRKIGIGGALGSVIQIPISQIGVDYAYSSTGTTESNRFYLRCIAGTTGHNAPLVSTGNYATIEGRHLRFTNVVPLGYTASSSVGGFIGASGQTFGFMTSLLGAYPVVSNGWLTGPNKNSSFTLEIPHIPIEVIASTADSLPPLGIPYGVTFGTGAGQASGLSAMTIMRTVIHVNNSNGFLICDRDTNVSVGGGVGSYNLQPIMIVNTFDPTNAEGSVKSTSNSVGIQTRGNVYIADTTGIYGFPVGVHVVDTGKAVIEKASIVGCYNAVAADAASLTLKGTVINRNQFGVSVAENAKADIRNRTILQKRNCNGFEWWKNTH